VFRASAAKWKRAEACRLRLGAVRSVSLLCRALAVADVGLTP